MKNPYADQYIYYTDEPIVASPDTLWYSYVVYPHGLDGLEARFGY